MRQRILRDKFNTTAEIERAHRSGRGKEQAKGYQQREYVHQNRRRLAAVTNTSIKMISNQFTSMRNRYETSSETDDFLLCALQLKNPVSIYPILAEHPSCSTSYRNEFSIISFSIRNIPRQFDTFIDTTISPLGYLSDVICLCETK